MAAIPRRVYELHALSINLHAYLTTAGFSLPDIRKGRMGEQDIVPPVVAIHYLPSRYIEKQLGRSIQTDKSFERRVQIDAYMGTEALADSIGDVCSDFLDEFFINIKEPDDTIIGDLYCPDSETIVWDVQPPLTRIEVERWRMVVSATLRSDYHV